MALSRTKSYQAVEAESSRTAKKGKLLFLSESKPLQKQGKPHECHGSKPVMFAKECVFQVATIVKIFSKSTYKAAIELGINSQQPPTHACLFDPRAGLSFCNKVSLKNELLSNIKNQRLPSLRTAIKKPLSLDRSILLVTQIGDLFV